MSLGAAMRTDDADPDEEPRPVPRVRPESRRRREDDDDDEPRRPSQDLEATDLLFPSRVRKLSIVCCYLGLLGCILPLIGLPFALIAFTCGVFDLRNLYRRGQSASYHSVTGTIRTVIGLVLSGSGLLLWGSVLVIMLLNPKK
jgi:hypothetical protein